MERAAYREDRLETSVQTMASLQARWSTALPLRPGLIESSRWDRDLRGVAGLAGVASLLVPLQGTVLLLYGPRVALRLPWAITLPPLRGF